MIFTLLYNSIYNILDFILYVTCFVLTTSTFMSQPFHSWILYFDLFFQSDEYILE